MLDPRIASQLLRHGEVWLTDIVSSMSKRAGVPFRPLELQALLHLPRLADTGGRIEVEVASGEVERLAHELPPTESWARRTKARSAGDLLLGPVDESTARGICEQYHYLRSHRLGSRSFGAYPPDDLAEPIALVITTRVDVASLTAVLAPDILAGEARVVARVFAFSGAPRNTLSRLLAYIAREEARDLGSRQLLTYVNPNLGFGGASYLASAWRLAGDEPGTTYRYIDGRYTTDRELERRFGSRDDERLRSSLRSRYARSVMPLRPLLIFSREIAGRH
jgi:hypothetical protein